MVVAYHRIEDGEQLSHASSHDDLERLAGPGESLGECFDRGVPTSRHECCHVEHAAHRVPASGDVALGEMLYSRYLFPFEIAGLILLVAMVGAIVLTHRKRRDTRPQKIAKQIARRPGDAVKNLDPEVGEGMKL